MLNLRMYNFQGARQFWSIICVNTERRRSDLDNMPGVGFLAMLRPAPLQWESTHVPTYGALNWSHHWTLNGIWMFLARRLATSTYTMDWLCLSDGWPLSSCQLNSNWGNGSKGDVSQAPTKHGDYDLEVVGGLVMVRWQQEDGYSFSVKHDPLIDLGSLLNFLVLPHTTTTSD